MKGKQHCENKMSLPEKKIPVHQNANIFIKDSFYSVPESKLFKLRSLRYNGVLVMNSPSI